MAYWYDLHWQGGMEFMAPLSFLFAISILIFLFLLISTIVRKRTYAAWMERCSLRVGMTLQRGYGRRGRNQTLYPPSQHAKRRTLP